MSTPNEVRPWKNSTWAMEPPTSLGSEAVAVNGILTGPFAFPFKMNGPPLAAIVTSGRLFAGGLYENGTLTNFAAVPTSLMVQVVAVVLLHPDPEKVASQLEFSGVAVMVTGVFALRLTGDAEQVKAVERMVQVAPVTGVVAAVTLFAPTTLPLLLAESVKGSVA